MATAPPPPGTPGTGAQLADLPAAVLRYAAESATSGGGEIVLRLHPPELGELGIRVMVESRNVSVWFASPHLAVQQALDQTINQLQTGLGSTGYTLVGAWIGADGSGADSRNSGVFLPPRARRRAEHQAPEPSLRVLPSSGRGVSVYA